MDYEAQRFFFEPEGGIPNSRLPLVFWKGRLPQDCRDGQKAQALFRRNGWQGTWTATVFPYWHFHTRGHEALACVSGSARIALGGDGGIVVDVEAGDVTLIPAGVGHNKLKMSANFLMAGCYPPGQQGNIVRPGDLDETRIAREIAAVELPRTDPISGGDDGVVAAWRDLASG
jgi:uncharacterized protein YjlB